ANRMVAKTRPNQRRIVISIVARVGSQRLAEKLGPKIKCRCGQDEALFQPNPVTVKGICFSTSCKPITDMGIRKYGLSCIENMKSGMVWRKI
ncbi:MAG TPA: hypothetical protein VGK96_12865, partial [Candidatus Sulfotelmatobacter sp.]